MKKQVYISLHSKAKVATNFPQTNIENLKTSYFSHPQLELGSWQPGPSFVFPLWRRQRPFPL